jgi:hypothetical protein
VLASAKPAAYERLPVPEIALPASLCQAVEVVAVSAQLVPSPSDGFAVSSCFGPSTLDYCPNEE